MEALTNGIELTGTLYTSAQGDAKDKLAYAELIWDNDLLKYQSDINKEMSSGGSATRLQKLVLGTEEDIDPDKDFAVRMKDGSIYMVKDIDWSEGDSTEAFIQGRFRTELWETESLPKFTEILSYGDLSKVDYKISLANARDVILPKVDFEFNGFGAYKYNGKLPHNINPNRDCGQMVGCEIPIGFKLVSPSTESFGNFMFCKFNDYYENDEDIEAEKKHYFISYPNATKLNWTFVNVHLSNMKELNFSAPKVTECDHTFMAAMFNYFPFVYRTSDSVCSSPFDFSNVETSDGIFQEAKLLTRKPLWWNYQGLNSLISDFRGFKFTKLKKATGLFLNASFPSIIISLPVITNISGAFNSEDIKEVYITELGTCAETPDTVVLGVNIEKLEINMQNVTRAGWISTNTLPARHVYLTNLKETVDLSNFPLMDLDSATKIIETLQDVTGKTLTFYSKVYDKIPADVLASAPSGWTITSKSTDELDKFWEKNSILGDEFKYVTDALQESIDSKADIEDLSNVIAEKVATIPSIEQVEIITKEDITLEINDAVATKLDKSVYDEEHEKFGIVGYWNKNGVASDDSIYRRTGLIPINHDYDIVTHCWGTANVAALAMFDAAGSVISVVTCNTITAMAEKRVSVAAADIPAEAVYFAAATGVSHLAESSWSNGPTQESREGAVSEAIQASKLALFVDMWTKCYDCQYYATKEKPFTCNGVELTYDEAVIVYNTPRLTYNNATGFATLCNEPKTIILGSKATNGRTVDFNNNFRTGSLVAIRIAASSVYARASNMTYCFYGLSNLEKILGNLGTGGSPIPFDNAFYYCKALKQVNIHELCSNISFSDSPLLSIESLLYLVANAVNTSAITVTMHPDVYNKLNDDGEDLLPYIPINLLNTTVKANSSNTKVVNGAMEVTREDKDTYFSVNLDETYTPVSGQKYTVSFDVEGMTDGESLAFRVNLLNSTNEGNILVHNGRCVGTVTANNNTPFNLITFDDALRSGLDMTITTPIKLSNFTLTPGEYETLPYVQPISSITDEELKERVKWRSVLLHAATKNINFATT